MIRFGPSGNSDSFYESGYKSSVQMPKWLSEMGLDAYEYQCGKGIRGENIAKLIRDKAMAHDIKLSIHAPYYINLASEDAEKREKSKQYILDSMHLAKVMGADRIVVHTGSVSKVDREWAVETASNVLRETLREAEEMGLSDITICPEVLGKINQLGDLDEIIKMCSVDDRLIPTIDFGHLHARCMGCLNNIEDFEQVLAKISNGLGDDRLKKLHIHFSKVEFTKGGEKRHRKYDETNFGPDFEPLASCLVKRRMEPVIICESRGTMAEDALKIKNIYEKVLGETK